MRHIPRSFFVIVGMMIVSFLISIIATLTVFPFDADAGSHTLQGSVTTADTIYIPKAAEGFSMSPSGGDTGYILPGGPFEPTVDLDDSCTIESGDVVSIDFSDVGRKYGTVYVYPGSGVTVKLLVW